MQISAQGDYAVRAAIELAARPGEPMSTETIASRQEIPLPFCAKILNELRSAGLVRSRRGPGGGYLLQRAPEEMALIEILEAVEGPFGEVSGRDPEMVHPPGSAAELRVVWLALRTSMKNVVEGVTLADVVDATVPAEIAALAGAKPAKA
ncbi:MAG TPA: Rrf2 family transcriptional regulator [Solirubrobacterales bacterium]